MHSYSRGAIPFLSALAPSTAIQHDHVVLTIGFQRFLRLPGGSDLRWGVKVEKIVRLLIACWVVLHHHGYFAQL